MQLWGRMEPSRERQPIIRADKIHPEAQKWQTCHACTQPRLLSSRTHQKQVKITGRPLFTHFCQYFSCCQLKNTLGILTKHRPSSSSSSSPPSRWQWVQTLHLDLHQTLKSPSSDKFVSFSNCPFGFFSTPNTSNVSQTPSLNVLQSSRQSGDLHSYK